MRRTLRSVLAFAVLVPAVGQAQWMVGARTGYSLPLGDADGTLAMSDAVTGQIPIQLDVGYRMNRLSVGGYLSYGFGDVAGYYQDTCDLAGRSCSSSSFRLGAQVLWSLVPPTARSTPWLGVGLGYDGVTVRGLGSTLGGFELLLQGGHDWRVGQTGALGLFASFSVGGYTTVSEGGSSFELADKTLHEWLTLGVRGGFGL